MGSPFLPPSCPKFAKRGSANSNNAASSQTSSDGGRWACRKRKRGIEGGGAAGGAAAAGDNSNVSSAKKSSTTNSNSSKNLSKVIPFFSATILVFLTSLLLLCHHGASANWTPLPADTTQWGYKIAAAASSGVSRDTHAHGEEEASHNAIGASYHGPESAYNAPEPSYEAPQPSYEVPEQAYQASEPSYEAPEPSYNAPEPAYEAPGPSYEAPEPSYEAPEPSYHAPEPSYNAPEPSYGAPEPSYGPTTPSYEPHYGGQSTFPQVETPGTYDTDLIQHTLREWGFTGGIYPRHAYGYENFRKVKNGACNHRYPLVIIRPGSTRDVAVAVRVAKHLRLPVSVRSGGHSYTCMSLKHDSLHFDMRRFKKVQLLPPDYHRPGVRLLRLGPGSTWERVLKLIPEEHFTLMHGQCLDVGVGGYLLGGGVNIAGSTNRYGTGSEHVEEYKTVTADGDILIINKHNVTKVDPHGDGYGGTEVVSSYGENDLFFAMKGAGSSFGITTEFLYRIYPSPETRPVVLFVIMRGIKDMKKVEMITREGRFQVSVYRLNYFRKISMDGDNFQNNGLVTASRFLKRWSGSSVYPVVVMFADIRTPKHRTDLGAVLRIIRKYRLKNAMPSTLGMDRQMAKVAGLDFYDANWQNYERLYLSEKERRHYGPQAYISANVIAAKKPEEFAHLLFGNKLFSVHHDVMRPKLKPYVGCDLCMWFYSIWTPPFKKPDFGVNDSGSTTLHYAVDITCQYNPRRHRDSIQCKKAVDAVRYRMNADTAKYGNGNVRQYYNTPSCHDVPNEQPFWWRYWGPHYPHLLAIKEKWDPYNMFNHCHSVGSTEEMCCEI